MTPEQIEQERAAFEAWYLKYLQREHWLQEDCVYIDKREDGTYYADLAQTAWQAWLERAQQGGWIKNAKDSRPKYYGRNIVSTKLGNVFVADYDKHFCRWEMGGKIIDGVTHWQPLPQPPAGDPT